MAFDITGITAQLGENHSIVEVTKAYNTRGDATVTKTNYSIFGIIQIMDGSEDECREGLLTVQDIICFYDDTQTYLSKLVNGNQILYNSKYYAIKNVISNPGHVEVWAKKV
jgi:hypothetical protein